MGEGKTYINRKQAASILGVSETTIRKLEGGLIRVYMAGPKHVFDREEILHARDMGTLQNWTNEENFHRKMRAADAAAAVFRLLNEGVEPTHIVSQLKIFPEFVAQCLNQWRALKNLPPLHPFQEPNSPGLKTKKVEIVIAEHLDECEDENCQGCANNAKTDES